MQKCTKTEQANRGGTDSLTDVIRTGAQQLLTQALKAEAADLFSSYADQRDEQGHTRVVLPSHHPKRDIQPGIGPVTVHVPKVRSRQGTPARFIQHWYAQCAQAGEHRRGNPVVVLERHLNRRDAAGSGSPRGPRGQRAFC